MWLERSLVTVAFSVVLYLFLFIYLKKSTCSFKTILGCTLLHFYAFEVLYITILPFPLDKLGAESLQMMATNSSYINLIPIIGLFKYDLYSLVRQVVGNIVLFIPLGFLLPIVSGKCKGVGTIIKYSFIASLFIEALQLIISIFVVKAPIRVFDINDLILNTLGAVVGYILYSNIKMIVCNKHKNKVDTDS